MNTSKLSILSKPYLTVKDISALTGWHRNKVGPLLQKAHVQKRERFGYYTPDVVKALGMDDWYETLMTAYAVAEKNEANE